jgi:uncharacterized protein (DUF427 family)
MARPVPLPIQPGQESVWDYPRPPRLEQSPRRIRVIFNSVTIVDTTRAWRVLETSHPPTYYLPPEDIRMDLFAPASGGSMCEWKGAASYFTLTVDGQRLERVAWAYPKPWAPFEPIAGFLAMYAAPMDAAYVDNDRVTPQPGGFYGGWITPDVVGPFKGIPGSMGW